MGEQRQDDLLDPTYNSVLIQDVTRKQWTIEAGGEKGSRISVLIARPEDVDDEYLIQYIRIWEQFEAGSIDYSKVEY